MKKIDFEVQTDYGLYRDALYVNEDISNSDIELMKDERVNNWIYNIENPPPEQGIESLHGE